MAIWRGKSQLNSWNPGIQKMSCLILICFTYIQRVQINSLMNFKSKPFLTPPLDFDTIITLLEEEVWPSAAPILFCRTSSDFISHPPLQDPSRNLARSGGIESKVIIILKDQMTVVGWRRVSRNNCTQSNPTIWMISSQYFWLIRFPMYSKEKNSLRQRFLKIMVAWIDGKKVLCKVLPVNLQ